MPRAGGLTAKQKVERDRKLVADRMNPRKPMTWAALAAKYKMDERSARRIFHDWYAQHARETVDYSNRDPIGIVWESVARYENWIEQLALIALAPETGEAVRVGAINSQMGAQAKLIDLLQATGILPRQLGKLRIEADARYTAQAILKVFQEENVPEHIRRRVIEAITQASSAAPSRN